MTINKVPSSKPGVPDDLTETGVSKPGTPANLTETAKSSPANPANLAETAKSSPANPVNLAETAKSDPGAPVTLSRLSDSSPANPANLSEQAKSTPSSPVNLAETALRAPLAPLNLTETARGGINRTLTPLFNFNADLGLPDSVTYSRSSSASYVETYKDPLGRNKTRLTNDYVGSVTNLVTYSEQFDNAAWVKANTIVNANSEVNPIDGARTADKVTNINSANDRVFINDLATAVGVDFLLSTMIKNIDTYIFSVAARSSSGALIRAYFDFSGIKNGDPQISINSGDPVPFKKYLGDGWYQVGIKFTTTASSYDLEFDINRQGEINKSVYLFGAQLTLSDKPLPYVKTLDTSESKTFTANPRYEEKGLLVEGASTNLATYSEDINDASWSKTGLDVTSNNTISPDGSFSADKLQTNSSGARFIAKGINLSSDSTLSVFAKAGNVSFICLDVVDATGRQATWTFNLANGEVGDNILSTLNSTARIQKHDNGWFRVSLSIDNLENSSHTIRIYPATSASLVTTSVGDNIYIWGAQLEALPFATSYIRTTTAAVSRGTETVFQTLYKPLSNQFTMLVEYDFNYLGPIRYLATVSSGSNNDRIALISSDDNGNLRTLINTSLQSFADYSSAQGTDPKVLYKAVVTVSNESKTYLNGELIGSDSTTAIPNFNKLSIAGDAIGSSDRAIEGHIKRVEIYDLVLTANEVKAL